MKITKIFAFFIAVSAAFAAIVPASAQKITRAAYLDRYKELAVAHMEKYGIPASIKMAQGMLESDNGNSRLAAESNNHFGIKCKAEWAGATVFHDDDAPDECFRAYASPEESWADHSEFLDKRPYYQSLFELSPADYKGWAYGLKAAGYATDPLYAEKLIKIIEDNQLYLLDRGGMPSLGTIIAQEGAREGQFDSHKGGIDIDNYVVAMHNIGGRGIYGAGRERFVISREGDTLRSLATLVGIRVRRLARINRLDADSPLEEGQLIKL